jgi:shikimate dehydrogenase
MLFEKIKTYELAPPDVIELFAESKLIVNASSIGMSPEEDDSPTSIVESFNSNQIVFDLVYNPRKTKFLAIAESQGATILNGLKMFVEQGAKAFELWTNEKMPTENISEILNKEPEL